MSGIVGGAGAKSGIIGQTELDYEEGAFTPSWTSASATPSYASRVAKYTRIGPICYIGGYIWSNGMSGTLTNPAYVTGLPFTSSATAADSCISVTSTYGVEMPSGRTFMGGEAYASDTKLFICQLGSDTNNASITAEMLNAGTCIFQFGGWYKIG